MLKQSLLIFLSLSSFNLFAVDRVLVTVNGTDITQSAVDNFMQQIKRSVAFNTALAEMISVQVLATEREKIGLNKDSQLQLEIDRNRNAILAGDMLKKLISTQELSDVAIKDEYEKTYLSKNALQEYRARHILVKAEEDAKKIISALNQQEDFSKLAEAHSTGPSGKNGGDLGWFTADRMVKSFSEATASLSKGEYTKTPVKTKFGWHIILLDDLKTNTPPSFNDVKDKIKRKLSAQMLQTQIKALQQKASIIIHTKDAK